MKQTAKKRVLIIGGTGVFGQRLAHHLAGADGIALIVSSRNLERAEQLASKLGNCAKGIALDTKNGFNSSLEAIKPWAVIDCSGPFQSAGYETAKTVIRSGAHMIDLADARRYLLGYKTALDADAKAAGVIALAGASSTPTLSNVVVCSLTKGWQSVHSIDIFITPGGKSQVGEAVIEAVLSYAGKDIPIWRNGHLAKTKGWVTRTEVNIPGLGNRWVSPVETADAELLGAQYPDLQHVSFKAGLESRLEHFGMNALANIVQLGFVSDLHSLAPYLKSMRKLTRLTTSDRGGMMVEIQGRDKTGKHVTARWTLIAENNHGPNVPVLAAAAAIRLLLESSPAPHAHLASELLALNKIEREMKPYDLTTSVEFTPN